MERNGEVVHLWWHRFYNPKLAGDVVDDHEMIQLSEWWVSTCFTIMSNYWYTCTVFGYLNDDSGMLDTGDRHSGVVCRAMRVMNERCQD